MFLMKIYNEFNFEILLQFISFIVFPELIFVLHLDLDIFILTNAETKKYNSSLKGEQLEREEQWERQEIGKHDKVKKWKSNFFIILQN